MGEECRKRQCEERGKNEPRFFASEYAQTTDQQPKPKGAPGYEGCQISATGVTDDSPSERQEPKKQNHYARPRQFIMPAIPSSRRTRSSMGGWVLKSDISAPPLSGLTMNM